MIKKFSTTYTVCLLYISLLHTMISNITIKKILQLLTHIAIKELTKLINLSNIISKINNFQLNKLQAKIVSIHNFIKLFCVYIIEKYYYKLNCVYFVLKANRHTEIFNFFVTLNTLKEKFVCTQPKPTIAFKLFYYYFIMFIALIVYMPITFFLLRVNTDAQNWMLHYFDDMNLCNLL